MNEKKFLPIGTVCTLKDGKKSLMIIGFCQGSVEDPEKIYDYAGCLFPEGILSSEVNFLFNHDQIGTILYNGLVNEEEIKFKTRLNEFLTTGKIDGQVVNIDEDGNILLGDKDISYQAMLENQNQTLSQNLQNVGQQSINVFNQAPAPQPSTPVQPVPMQQVQAPVAPQPSTPVQPPMFNTLNINQPNSNQ